MKGGIFHGLLSPAWLLPLVFSVDFCSSGPGSATGEAAILSLLTTGIMREEAECPLGTVLPEGVYLADRVTSASAETGSGFGDVRKATNGVCGAGAGAGSLDVYSMDATGAGSVMILEWSGRRVLDGGGIDFVVFENPFGLEGTADRFMDLIVVDVGIDMTKWCGFHSDYTYTPETSYSRNPAHWVNFAGKTPVLWNQQNRFLDASDVFDASRAGGDGFDLADLSAVSEFGNGCDTLLRSQILSEGFLYLRLRAAPDLVNPHTGSPFVKDLVSNGPDIDGVAARFLVER